MRIMTGIVLGLVTSCSPMSLVYHESENLLSKSGLVSFTEVSRRAGWALPAGSSFYVARSASMPRLAAAQSRDLADTLAEVIAGNFGAVRVGVVPESQEYAVNTARAAGMSFVVFPRLQVWDDRFGTWREIFQTLNGESSQAVVDGFGLDQARLQIIILDSTSGAMVDMANVAAESGLLSLYGDSPLTVLRPALEEYFSNLAT